MASSASIFGLVFLIGCISATKHPNIVGGSNTVIKRFPFLISIRYNGRHNCGGSIISDRHILTAAHCMYRIDDEDLINNLTIHSATSRSDKVGNVHKVLSIHSHPEFNITNDAEGYPYDIAVLTLSSPIVFDKYQQKINLPSHNVHIHQIAYVVGWGMTTNGEWESAKQLQKLRVALLPYDICKPLLKHNMNPETICAFRSSSTGACHGDSGGPLISQDEIVGIVSYGDTGKCANTAPDVYTNVFAYRDFIESAMNE